MAEKKSPEKTNAKPKKRRSKLSQGIVIALIGAAGTILGAVIAVTLPSFLPKPAPTPVLATPTPIPVSIIDAKGINMRLIPEGKFIMGSNDGNSNAQPSHQVYLASFYIDEYEVTNEQYRNCENTKPKICDSPIDRKSPLHSNYYDDPQYNDYPVVWVNWNMAKKFCEWRDANLPTEAQWEKAARSPDSRSYPWGEEISCRNANYAGCVGDTLPVGLFEDGKSVYGVYDMVGNVAEWVADWYSDTYYSTHADGQFDPTGPVNGQLRVVRGGSWYVKFNGIKLFERIAYLPSFADRDLGFRCARDYEP
jgi:formylglycine-generating enzyme required for sulfatase activity